MIASIAPPSQSPTGLPWSTLKHLLQDISGITALTQQATGWATPFLLSLSSAAAPSGIPPYLSKKRNNLQHFQQALHIEKHLDGRNRLVPAGSFLPHVARGSSRGEEFDSWIAHNLSWESFYNLIFLDKIAYHYAKEFSVFLVSS